MARMAMTSLLVMSALLCGVKGVRMNKHTAMEVSDAAQDLSRWKVKTASLKVGDKAKVLIENDRRENTAARRGTKGMIGVIIQDDKSDVPFQVEFSDGRKLWYKAKWLGDVPENHPDWLATMVLEPNATCDMIEGATNRSSQPFPDCKCKNYRHSIYCLGKVMAGRKYNITHIARDISECQVSAKCQGEPVCEDIEGGERRNSKDYPYCKCKEDTHKVKCADTVVDFHKFKADYVYTFCAKPRCAVAEPVCEDIEGAEGRESEKYPNCKCKEEAHMVKCNDTMVVARKFNADDVYKLCAEPRCASPPVCEDIEGAEGRDSEAYPNCKCKEEAHKVKCNDTVVDARKFKANDVYKLCAKPRCASPPICEDIEGAESRDSEAYPNCKCKEEAHKVKCNDTVVDERKFKADDVYKSCAKPRCAVSESARTWWWWPW